MRIGSNKVVSVDYTLTGDSGEVLDTSKGHGPLDYLHGTGGIVPGLEEALDGHVPGDRVQVTILPKNAYGERDEKLVDTVPRSAFKGVAKVEKGMQFQAQHDGHARIVTVLAADDQTVHIDANHPMAGRTLHFDVTVVAVREATPEEIAHGHVHGPGGHSH